MKIDRKKQVLETLTHYEEIRVAELTKLLGMWQSNLNKKLIILEKERHVKRYKKGNYAYVCLVRMNE